MVFRLSFLLVGGVIGFCQAWMPTNWLVRWLATDRGLRWAVPVSAVLAPAYWSLGHAFQDRLDAGASAWWWVAFAWALVNCLKFLSVGVRAPFVWLARTVRRRLARRSDDVASAAGDSAAPSGSRPRPPSDVPERSRP